MPVLLEIHYLPCIQYFSKFFTCDGIILDDLEAFEKQSYRNRCTIAGANGPIDLIIPVHDSRRRVPIKEVQIDNHGKWQSQHWKSIRSAYGKTAFFEHYAHNLAPFYEKPFIYLFDFDIALLTVVMKMLKIGPGKLELASNHYPQVSEVSFKNKIHPKVKYRANDPDFEAWPYLQAFEQKLGFLPNLSIIDLVFNEGPEATSFLNGTGQ